MQRLYSLTLVAIPLLTLVLIQWGHYDYPRTDGAAYSIGAYQNLEKIEKQGLWQGLRQIYFQDRFKPTLMSSTLMPILAIFDGDIRWATTVQKTLQYIIVGILCFLILCRFLSTPLALISTSYILSFVWLYNFTLHTQPELPTLVFSLLGVFFFFKSDRFNHGPFTVLSALFFAISLCLRPALGFLHLCLPIGYFAYLALRQGQVTKNVISFMAIVGLIPTFYFLPHIERLYYYLHTSSFGFMARHTGQREGVSFFEQIFHIVYGFFGHGLFILFPLMVFLFFFKKNETQGLLKNTPLKDLLFFGGLGAAPALIVGASSYSGEVRYYFSHLLVLALGLIALLMQQSLGKKILVPMMSLLIFWQCYFVLQKVYGDEHSPKSSITKALESSSFYQMTSAGHMTKVGQSLSPPESLFQLIERPSQSSVAKVAVLPLYGDHDYKDPWRLEVMARDKRLPIDFSFPYELRGEPQLEIQLKKLEKNYDYAWIGPLNSSSNKNWNRGVSGFAQRYNMYINQLPPHKKPKIVKRYVLKGHKKEISEFLLIQL